MAVNATRMNFLKQYIEEKIIFSLLNYYIYSIGFIFPAESAQWKLRMFRRELQFSFSN